MGLATRQWIALSIFYTTYLIFGASVFYHIEHELEGERRDNALQDRIDVNELLVEYAAPYDPILQNIILTKVSNYCGKPVTNYTLDEFEPPYQWTFYHSIFFAFTVCSTLGYGNIAPTTTFSRYFMIAYALIGMPVNGILFAYLGDYFGSKFTSAYQRYKAKKAVADAVDDDRAPPQLGLITQITLTLVPASLILIFLPSCLFTYFEGWPYSVSVYYSFVTLSTIGFGDFIPTFQPHQERTFGIYFTLYEMFVLIWFVFGLSYILMLIAFIAKGMQSKRIARLEQQLSDNIISTHTRIWSGVMKDVGYLRRILNEVYVIKAEQSIFEEPACLEYFEHRSRSCPDLTMYSPRSPLPHRRRAFSEHFCEVTDADGGILGMRAVSHNSENNLLRTTRDRPFEGQGRLDQTSDLLVNVVRALTNFEEEELNEGGVHLFSDSQIKLDDVSSTSNLATDNNSVMEAPRKLRARAASEHGWNRLFRNVQRQQEGESRDWTWSGNNPQIHEFMKIRAKQKEREKNLTGENGDAATRNGVADVERGPPEPDRRPSIMQRFNNLFKRRSTLPQDSKAGKVPLPEQRTVRPKSPIASHRQSLTVPQEKAPTMDRRKSFIKRHSLSRPQLKKQPSSFSVLSSVSDQDQEVLESTTIADLIRAIETVHLRDNGLDPRLAATRLPLPIDTPSPMLRKPTIAYSLDFTAGPYSKSPTVKSNVASSARISPLPAFDTSDDSSRRSSVTWDRLRHLRQHSVTEPSKPDLPIKTRDDPRTKSFAAASAKNKFLEEKRQHFARRFSAFPASGQLNDATAVRWTQQMKKNVSDVDRRLSAVQAGVRHNVFGANEYPLISQLIMNRTKEELSPQAGRRFSSALSQPVQASRSVQVTPITLRRTSLLPISPLAGIPSESSLVVDVGSDKAKGASVDGDEESKKTSRWRIIKRLVTKLDDQDSEPRPNS